MRSSPIFMVMVHLATINQTQKEKFINSYFLFWFFKNFFWTDYIYEYKNKNSATQAINIRNQTQDSTKTLTLSDEFYNKCLNKEKLCFGLPKTKQSKNCIESKNCAILSSSFANSGKITFELLAAIETNQQNYYIAYGLSKLSVNIFCIFFY